MSDMKCPFCQQELNTENYYIHCHNPHCDKTVDMDGNEELWQELITTRKALDVAVDALNGVCKDLPWIKRALEQINEITKGKENAIRKAVPRQKDK